MASDPHPEPFVLPQDFLLNPLPSPPLIRPIHFAQTPLVDYARYYAIVLDNVLSAEECDQLLRAAEETTNGEWEEAMVNIGGGRQALSTDVRNSGRIIWDSDVITQRIWDRVKPYLESRLSDDAMPFDEGSDTWEEGKSVTDSAMQDIGFEREEEDDANTKCILHDSGIGVIEGDKASAVGVWTKKPQRWVCQGLNERMRFLKYQDEQYFKPHIDGPYVVPGSQRKKMTIFTLHLYLNEAGPTNPLKGGATSFFGGLTAYWESSSARNDVGTMHVAPKTGRILVFQHNELVHSGQDVASGVKYTMRTDLMYHAEPIGTD